MDQQAHAPPPANPPVRPSAPARGKLPDIIVMVATPLVAAALAMALNLQMGVRLVESVAIAGLLAVGLLLGHALMKREQAMREMRNEMNRLAAMMHAYGRPPMPGPRPMMAGRPPMPPPMRPMPQAMETGAPMPSYAGMPPSGPAPAAHDSNAPMPPSEAVAVATSREIQPPSVPPMARAEAPVPHELAGAELAPDIDGSDDRRRIADSQDAHHAARVHAVAAEEEQGTAQPVVGALPPVDAQKRRSELHVPEREAASSGQELRDLEMMQNLVEQLANQLGSGRVKVAAELAPSQSMADADTSPKLAMEAAVAVSVDALRATATTMRETLEPTPFPSGSVPAEMDAAAPTSAQAPEAERIGSESDPRIAVLAAALEKNDFEVLLEPIVGLGDRKARHFEVAIKLHGGNGTSFDEEAQREIAAGSGVLPRIDAVKLKRSANVAERLDARGNAASLFSGLVGESLADDHFLDTFEDVFGPRRELLSRLVLAFHQSDVRAFADGHWQIVNAMSEVGMRFALDGVTDLDMDFEKLRKEGFQFVKLDADVFLEGLPADGAMIPAEDLCRHLSDLGLSLIVKRIEDESRLSKILGFGAVLGQGTMLGGARPVRIEAADTTHAAA